MFSQEYDNEISHYFHNLTALLEHRAEELKEKVGQLPVGERGFTATARRSFGRSWRKSAGRWRSATAMKHRRSGSCTAPCP